MVRGAGAVACATGADQPTAQAAPLRVKPVGAGFEPVHDPLKPKLVWPPAGMETL
jgi:hypothetical protein